MERAELGTVSEARPMSWAALRYVIISLLDALAHAHARRVITAISSRLMCSSSPIGV
jgi:hypothetical protein